LLRGYQRINTGHDRETNVNIKVNFNFHLKQNKDTDLSQVISNW